MKFQGKKLLVVADMANIGSVSNASKWMKFVRTHFEFKNVIFALYSGSDTNTLNNESDHVYSLQEKDINIFGRPKNPVVRFILEEKYDSLLAFGMNSQKLIKVLNKNKTVLKIGANVAVNMKCTLRLNTNNNEIIKLTEFTSDTIGKIAFNMK